MRRSLFTLLLPLTLLGSSPAPARAVPVVVPGVTLWAWERGEDLRFLPQLPDGSNVRVAFFASMIGIDAEGPWVRRRREPVRLDPRTERIAVLRIHVETGGRARWDDTLRTVVEQEVRVLVALPSVRGIQLDFDARVSELEVHRQARAFVRSLVPRSVSFSVTSIASACARGGRYDHEAPPDDGGELVPMYFAMGDRGGEIVSSLRSTHDPAAHACRANAGFGVGEPYVPLRSPREVFFFPREPWTRDGVTRVLALVSGADR